MRQPPAAGEPGRNPAWAALPSRSRDASAPVFDPEYAALRAALLALAREGHRLLGPAAAVHPEIDSRAVRGLLRRIDRFEGQIAGPGMEPVRRWVHNLRCRVLDTAAHRL